MTSRLIDVRRPAENDSRRALIRVADSGGRSIGPLACRSCCRPAVIETVEVRAAGIVFQFELNGVSRQFFVKFDSGWPDSGCDKSWAVLQCADAASLTKPRIIT